MNPSGRGERFITARRENAHGVDVRVRLVTQRLADAFATGIAAHPQDWHMLQKLWLDQPARV